MKKLIFLCMSAAILGLTSCKTEKPKAADEDYSQYTDEELDYLGITNREFLSAASKRALKWPKIGNEWFIEFSTYELKGDFAYEEGVVSYNFV